MEDVNVHLYLHTELSDAAHQKLDQILRAVGAVARQERFLMTTVADIQAQADKTLAAIAANGSKDDSIILLVTANTALITTLREQLAAAMAANDPAALQRVLDQLVAAESSSLANAQRVTDAVNANTTPPESAASSFTRDGAVGQPGAPR